MDTGLNTPNHITAYMHCIKCLEEMPEGTSPQAFARTQTGVTGDGGIQVWCTRHHANVMLLHPADFDKLAGFAHQCDACQARKESA